MGALARKYPNAGLEWAWRWVFSATRFYVDRATSQRRRHHLHESVLQRAVKDAVRHAGISKPATCHTLRHSFASILGLCIRAPRPHRRSPSDRLVTFLARWANPNHMLACGEPLGRSHYAVQATNSWAVILGGPA